MKKVQGFTLIELIIVIVILGILAVTSAPKFLNLADDAKTARLQGLQAAMESALDISHSKLVLQGLDTRATVYSETEAKVKAWCDFCLFSYGYPANLSNTWPHLVDGLAPDSDLAIAGGIPGDLTSLAFTFKDNIDSSQRIINLSCYIRYKQASSSSRYELELIPCS